MSSRRTVRTGYRYRGRHALPWILVVILLAAAGITAGVCFFAREFVSVENGRLVVNIDFKFPRLFPQSPPPAPQPSPSDDFSLIIENSPQPSAPPETQTSPSPEPAELKPGVTAYLPIGGLLPELEGVDTLIVELKSPEGVIISELPEDALKLRGQIQIAGYMSALLDNTITRSEKDFGIKHVSGVNWLDADRNRRINPCVPEARAWLAGLVERFAALPIDALIIDYVNLPNSGKISSAKLPDDTDTPLRELWDELAAAAEIPKWVVVRDWGNVPRGFDLTLGGDFAVTGAPS